MERQGKCITKRQVDLAAYASDAKCLVSAEFADGLEHSFSDTPSKTLGKTPGTHRDVCGDAGQRCAVAGVHVTLRAVQVHHDAARQQAVLDWAVANERWDLFERRVAKSVVEEIGAVPGVEIERGVRVNVRRS